MAQSYSIRARSLLALLIGHFAYLLRCAHAAEFLPAHTAIVLILIARLGKRLVMESTGSIGVERQVELVFPAELKAAFAHGIIAVHGRGMPLG